MVPAVGLIVGAIAYPLCVLVTVFRTANADISTRPGAPFAAVILALVALLAGLLVTAFVTMLAYTTLRFGRTPVVRGAQVAALGATTLGCAAGIWLIVMVAQQT